MCRVFAAKQVLQYSVTSIFQSKVDFTHLKQIFTKLLDVTQVCLKAYIVVQQQRYLSHKDQRCLARIIPNRRIRFDLNICDISFVECQCWINASRDMSSTCVSHPCRLRFSKCYCCYSKKMLVQQTCPLSIFSFFSKFIYTLEYMVLFLSVHSNGLMVDDCIKPLCLLGKYNIYKSRITNNVPSFGLFFN